MNKNTEELMDFILDNLFTRAYDGGYDPDWDQDLATLLKLRGYLEAAIAEKKGAFGE